jgi:DNA-binding XRE family transcriptional regulator
MLCIIANSEFKAIVNNELALADNGIMRYREYADRFRSLWIESDAPKVQKELAKWLGFSQPTISDWLNGVKLPSMDTALKTAKKFGCNTEWLLTGQGPKRPGEEMADPLYKEILSLSPEQRAAVELIVKTLNNTQKTEQTPLTNPAENVWGGGG